jgi:hypothetical protein
VAHQAALLAEPGQNANPIVSHLISAAIGYTDALTAKYGGTVNQQDHAAVVKAVRAALGNRVPEAALEHLGRILREKDAAQRPRPAARPRRRAAGGPRRVRRVGREGARPPLTDTSRGGEGDSRSRRSANLWDRLFSCVAPILAGDRPHAVGYLPTDQSSRTNASPLFGFIGITSWFAPAS